jgi:2-methylisocitrate lyase-like PEP mutase family enzyme
MKRMTTVLRELLAQPGLIVAPGCYDAFSARVAEHAGFKMVGVGGFAMGAHLTVSEPLIGLDELARITRYITAAVNIPLKVDAGAGYGEPLHVMRTVREIEAAGAAAIHLEDQAYPKRVHYHKGIEHVISAEDFLAKLKAAQAARKDPDFVIQARTDAMRTHGFAEGVRRSNLYMEAGADMIICYPNTPEETRQAPKEINGPISFLNSEGNHFGRPVFTHRELEDMGYKMVSYGITPIQAAAKGLREAYQKLAEVDGPIWDPAEAMELKQYVQDIVGLDSMYKVEAETVER